MIVCVAGPLILETDLIKDKITIVMLYILTETTTQALANNEHTLSV